MRLISPAVPDPGGTAPALGPPSAPPSWAARYGQAILRDGIATLPRALYLHQGRLDLSAQEVWFVSYILAHKWSADLPYPSLKGMAACTGVDLSWLKRLRRKLQDKRYLEIRERQDSRGGQATNSYDFAGLFAALEDCIAADPPLSNPIRDEMPTRARADLVEQDTSFIARFGRTVAQVGVAAVPQGLFRHQAQLQLTPQQLWFICYILAYQWDAGLPYPSLKRMAIRTGYSEPQLHTIKGTLVEKGYLELVHRYSADKGQDTNGYNFSRLLETMIRYLPAEPPEALPAGTPSVVPSGAGRRGRKRVSIPGSIADPEGGASSLVEGGCVQLSGEGVRTVEPEGARTVKPGGERTVKPGTGPVVQPGGVVRVVTGGAARLVGGGAASEAEEESDHEKSDHQEESNRSKSVGNEDPKTETVRYSPYIAAVILDFSQALGDRLHVPANVTQALRLWQQSGQPEQIFVEHYLYEAQTRTRQAQGAQGGGFIANKMAYFFQTLRDLVEQSNGQ